MRAGYADMSGIQVRFGINFYNNPWPLSRVLQRQPRRGLRLDHSLSPPQIGQMYAAGVADSQGSTPQPQAPTANFSTTTSGLTAFVDAGSSVDPDDNITDYTWSFGDSTPTQSGQTTPTHGAAAPSPRQTVTDA